MTKNIQKQTNKQAYRVQNLKYVAMCEHLYSFMHKNTFSLTCFIMNISTV